MSGTWKLWTQKAVRAYPYVYWVFIPTSIAGILLTILPYVEFLKITDKTDPRNVGIGLLLAAVSAAGVGYGLEYTKRDAR